jgi:hypothetical protein
MANYDDYETLLVKRDGPVLEVVLNLLETPSGRACGRRPGHRSCE